MDGFCFWCFVTLYSLFPHVTPVYFIIHKHAECQNYHRSYGTLTHSATKPFSPIPLQMQGPSSLNILPQGFSSNHYSSYYLSCYVGGIPGILHTVQDSQMTLKENSHSRENEFVPGAEVQRASTQGALHTVWAQSLFLRGALGAITPKPIPTISPRTPPRPGLGSVTTLLPCLALQGTGCPFSEPGHNFSTESLFHPQQLHASV